MHVKWKFRNLCICFQMNNPQHPYLVRTDFSHDSTWNELIHIASTPSVPYGFQAYLEPINSPNFQSQDAQTIAKNLPGNYPFAFLFLFDSLTQNHPEHPVLCVHLKKAEPNWFRVKPKHLWIVENNLSISNVDFEEFMEDLDENGIFKGF